MAGKRIFLRPLDRLFIGLNLLFALLYAAALFVEGFGGVSLLMLFLFVLTIPVGLLLIYGESVFPSPVSRWLRTFYPQGMFILYFTQSIRLSRIFHSRTFDVPVAGLEELIFGGRPVLDFFYSVPKYPLVNEIFFFAYFSFYFFLTLPWWVLFFKGKRLEAEKCLFTLIACFSLLYFWYIIFPVEGPKFFYPELRDLWYSPFSGGLFTFIMKSLFIPSTMAGAAFPSSHVAMGLLALLLAFRHVRPVGRILLPVYLLLVFSTVYLYTHYLVDILSGLIYGTVAFIVVPRLTDFVYSSRLKEEVSQ